MKPRALLLWDIDGTLITTGHVGIQAFAAGLTRRFGIVHDLAGIELAGRTDKSIATQLLRACDLPVTEENLMGLLDAYLTELAAAFSGPDRRGRALDGILPILEEIHHRRPDLAQGLLTGNLERGARIKLGHLDLHHFFPFGAFADDSHDRNALPPHARQRAETHHGVPFPPHRIYVIGDTPHDIACGQAIGAKTIAVATGNYSEPQLAACSPSVVFPHLGDIQRFFSWLHQDLHLP